MTDQDWKRIWTVFEEALTYEPARRRSFVAEQCGPQSTLADEILSLIDAHDSRSLLDKISEVALEVRPDMFV